MFVLSLAMVNETLVFQTPDTFVASIAFSDYEGTYAHPFCNN